MTEGFLEALAREEEAAVKALGDRIGYGRMIQLAEQLWTAMLPTDCPPVHYRASLEKEIDQLHKQVSGMRGTISDDERLRGEVAELLAMADANALMLTQAGRDQEALRKELAAFETVYETHTNGLRKEIRRLEGALLEAQARAIAADQNVQRIKQLENKSRHDSDCIERLRTENAEHARVIKEYAAEVCSLDSRNTKLRARLDRFELPLETENQALKAENAKLKARLEELDDRPDE